MQSSQAETLDVDAARAQVRALDAKFAAAQEGIQKCCDAGKELLELLARIGPRGRDAVAAPPEDGG